jgi:ABC-type multidrug transport system ATPase subunit/pSer/pThr/pTyr-binding forkhead associated (FHA) protein
MTGPFSWQAAGPVLVVEIHGIEKTLRPGPSYRVGRDPQSDIVIDDLRASWEHLVLRTEGGAWFAEDCGSTNGTFVRSRKIDRFEITDDCVLHIGSGDDAPAMSFSLYRLGRSEWPSVDRRPSAVMPMPARALRIGRQHDNDIVLTDLNVSRHHAELRNTGDGSYVIVDLDSSNGTFLNGARVIFTSPVTEQDIIGIGPATFRLFGGELRQFIDSGDVSLIAQDLTVRLPGGRVLLDRVSFPISERSLVAVIGPSGAGKTTLLRALTGMAPATEGAVLYDHRDLYSHYAELRHRIGLVPQEDVIYPHLTPRRALGYAAELRFPGDTSDEERSTRVHEVLDELKLNETTKDRPKPAADTAAAALSGGEKKRVNIALELLTKPSVLFLDEPTSSLDVELKEDVVDSMKELARDGRTIIMVTHDLEYLDLCDRVLVLKPGGQMVFYGPSDEGLRYFGKSRWVEVYRALRTEPERDWAGEFEQSSCYLQYVASGLTAQVPDSARGPSEPPPAPRSRLAQLAILSRRYTALIAADKGFLISLAIVPLVFGGLVRLLAGKQGLVGARNINAETTLLFLALIAVLGGAAGSVRELIKERAMYVRERTAGLSAGAYLLSKITVLGLITGLQAALLVLIGVSGVPLPRHGAYLPSPLVEILLAVVVLAIASMTVGLAVSAFVDSSEKTMQALVLIAIAQVMLSGGVLALGIGLQQLSYVAPARWGFGATASTADLNALLRGSGKPADPLWDHRPSAWLLAMGMQVLLVVVFTLIAWWRLLRIGPGQARPRLGFRVRRRSPRRPPASPGGQDKGVSRPPLARTPR